MEFRIIRAQHEALWPVLAAGWCALGVATTLVGRAAGDATWWLVVSNALSFWLLAPAPVLLLATAIAQRPLASAVCGTALVTLVAVHCALPPSPGRASGTVRLVTFNVDEPNTGGDTERVARLVHRDRPDVLLLQQLKPQTAVELGRRLPEMPIRYLGPPDPHDSSTGSVALLSRFPACDGRRAS